MVSMDKLRGVVSILISFLLLVIFSQPVAAASKMGMHVLDPQEMEKVVKLYQDVRTNSTQAENGSHAQADLTDGAVDPIYVTVPFGYADINRLEQWNQAFRLAGENNIIPLVRLSTQFNAQDNSWEIPNRYQLMKLMAALNQLDWPQGERHVILFNEPNHSPEWGGTFDVESLAQALTFTADWLHTEPANYVVLPPAMDLAAANTADTREAMGYWRQLLAVEPTLLDHFDAWNSHSYPNPGFMASPYRTQQNSLRGYEHELAFLNQYSDKKWPVYITETGWLARFSQRTLSSYYRYAVNNVWNDEQVVAVTPFLLSGAPGPFAEFSFLDAEGNPTPNWDALASVLQEFKQDLLTLNQ